MRTEYTKSLVFSPIDFKIVFEEDAEIQALIKVVMQSAAYTELESRLRLQVLHALQNARVLR